MDGTGARRPSATNIGQIRSLVVSTLSRTMRRAHSARRLRRGRVVRSSAGAAWSAVSTGTTRTRDSIGRPYLMAMSNSPKLRCFIPSAARPPAPRRCYGRTLQPEAEAMPRLVPICRLVPIMVPILAILLASPAAAETLRVGKSTLSSFSYTLLEVGMHSGIFQKHGLTIEFLGLWRRTAADPGDGRRRDRHRPRWRHRHGVDRQGRADDDHRAVVGRAARNGDQCQGRQPDQEC